MEVLSQLVPRNEGQMNSLSLDYQHHTARCFLNNASKIGFEVYFALKMLLPFLAKIFRSLLFSKMLKLCLYERERERESRSELMMVINLERFKSIYIQLQNYDCIRGDATQKLKTEA